jgi:hypothetical protein
MDDKRLLWSTPGLTVAILGAAIWAAGLSALGSFVLIVGILGGVVGIAIAAFRGPKGPRGSRRH